MSKQNAVTHALLNSDTHTNVYLIQEPWFYTISMAGLDTAQQGIDVLGGVASPGWEILYPVIPKGCRPKVMAYARRRVIDPKAEAPFTVVPCNNISDHPCIQVLDIVFDTTSWQIINFYHDV